MAIAAAAHTYNYYHNPSYARKCKSYTNSLLEITSDKAKSIWNSVAGLFTSDNSKSKKTKKKEDTKIGQYDSGVNVVDKNGHRIPMKKGETIKGNPKGTMVQVKDKDG